MSELKTCDQWVEHLDENTRHHIDQDTYEIVRETWGHAVSAGQDEIARLQSENKSLEAANRDLQDWFDDARDEVERLRERVAELQKMKMADNVTHPTNSTKGGDQ